MGEESGMAIGVTMRSYAIATPNKCEANPALWYDSDRLRNIDQRIWDSGCSIWYSSGSGYAKTHRFWRLHFGMAIALSGV
jgi:hypothetical protein